MFYLDLFSALDRHRVDYPITLKQAVGRPIDLSDIEHLQRIKQP